MFSKILVPTDGSEASYKALKAATEIAKIHEAQITVLSVVNELKLPFGAQYDLYAEKSHQELIRTTLEDLNQRITAIKQQEPALQIDTDIVEGSPGPKIVETAEKEGFDLIVMGKRGHGLIESLVMGSVTDYVVNHTDKMVLIVN